MTANVSSKSYTCDVCGKVNNNAGNHGRHVASHAPGRPTLKVDGVELVTGDRYVAEGSQPPGPGDGIYVYQGISGMPVPTEDDDDDDDPVDALQKLANAINRDPDNNGITFHNNGVGGYRPGSGRKPLAEGTTVTVAFVLTEELVARMNEHMEQNGIANKSINARRLIEKGLACPGHEKKRKGK